jgi:Protein of unknown function (DUF1153)
VEHKLRGARLNYVLGLDGSVITAADLPCPGSIRWTARRKAELVLAVEGGLLSADGACRRYALSMDEFGSWRRSLCEFGTSGLRATRAKDYRAQRKGGSAMPQGTPQTRLPPSVLNEWCARDEILKRARKLRWIGRAEEADKLLRMVWQGDDVRSPPSNKASE